MVMTQIARKAIKNKKSFVLGIRNLQMTTKEDDLLLLAPSAKKLQGTIQRWKEDLEDYNMNITLKETEVKAIANNQEDVSITINGQRIKQTSLIKYLGALFNCKGDVENDVNNIIK